MNFIHPSCWNPRKIVIWKNNVSFHSSFWDQIKTDRRTNYVSFHPLYRVSRRTDVQTLHFIRHNTIKVRQTDRLRFILPLNLDPSKTDGQLFHPSYWDQTKTDRQTSFHPSYWNPRKTDGQTVFHLTPRFDVLDRPTEKLRLISSLILESTYDRRTNYVAFHPSYWNPCMTDGWILHFTTHIGINVRQTDKLCFISPSTSDYVLFNSHVVVLDRQIDKLRFISLYLSSKWERQTILFHPLYWNPSKTDKLSNISSFILESLYDRRTDYFI